MNEKRKQIIDIKKEKELVDAFMNFDKRLSNLEEATKYNKNLVLKLVKQSSHIMRFLKEIEINFIDDFDSVDEYILKDIMNVNSHVDEDKQLKELEKELKKITSLITNGDDMGIA
tara:strand:+ start:150 stop:494 length:345 start_codon:yes stop_codon:yes gene_type:complete